MWMEGCTCCVWEMILHRPTSFSPSWIRINSNLDHSFLESDAEYYSHPLGLQAAQLILCLLIDLAIHA